MINAVERDEGLTAGAMLYDSSGGDSTAMV
jgi:hypothetical protein